MSLGMHQMQKIGHPIFSFPFHFSVRNWELTGNSVAKNIPDTTTADVIPPEPIIKTANEFHL